MIREDLAGDYEEDVEFETSERHEAPAAIEHPAIPAAADVTIEIP